MVAWIEPCSVRIRHRVEASKGLSREVGVGHFFDERPFSGCDKHGTIHGMAGFTEIDNSAGRKGHHIDASVCAASGLAELPIQIRSVLAGRDKNSGAAVLGMER